jgi:hypothetical protein
VALFLYKTYIINNRAQECLLNKGEILIGVRILTQEARDFFTASRRFLSRAFFAAWRLRFFIFWLFFLRPRPIVFSSAARLISDTLG